MSFAVVAVSLSERGLGDDNGALAIALLCFDPNVVEQPCTS